ncbi:MAG: D-tyrosyl-tRNA(Tyr) deacylase, partial [bacterium]|nr:D-tyrosyl-tRNA(Tyr) deacylase [bacterium]
MRAVIQRVARASVAVADRTVGEIDQGLLVLLGVGHNDGTAEAESLVDKLLGLRIFPDADKRMNLSVVDVG